MGGAKKGGLPKSKASVVLDIGLNGFKPKPYEPESIFLEPAPVKKWSVLEKEEAALVARLQAERDAEAERKAEHQRRLAAAQYPPQSTARRRTIINPDQFPYPKPTTPIPKRARDEFVIERHRSAMVRCPDCEGNVEQLSLNDMRCLRCRSLWNVTLVKQPEPYYEYLELRFKRTTGA